MILEFIIRHLEKEVKAEDLAKELRVFCEKLMRHHYIRN